MNDVVVTGTSCRSLSPSLIIFLWQIAGISKSKGVDIFKALDMYCDAALMESWPELHSLQGVWTYPQMGFWGLHLPASALSPRFSCLTFLFLSPSENNRKSLLSKIFNCVFISGKESTCQCQILRRSGFDPWFGKIPWRRKWQPTQVFLPRKFCDQRNLAGGLQSVGSQRLGQDSEQLSTSMIKCQHTYSSPIKFNLQQIMDLAWSWSCLTGWSWDRVWWLTVNEEEPKRIAQLGKQLQVCP